jgi:hypothetical protein
MMCCGQDKIQQWPKSQKWNRRPNVILTLMKGELFQIGVEKNTN